MGRSPLVYALLTLAVGACGAFVGTQDNGDADAGAADGGAGPDATADTSIADAGPGTTADVFANDAGTCTSGFCACAGDAHTFCDDFDKSPGFVDWSTGQATGGAITITEAGTFSPPHVALASIIASEASLGYLQLGQMPTLSQFSMEMDIEVLAADTLTGNGIYGICLLTLPTTAHDEAGTAPAYEIRVNAYADHFDLEQQKDGNTLSVQGAPLVIAPNVKGRFGMHYNLSTRSCGITWNGVELITSPTACKLEGAFATSPTEDFVRVGVPFARTPGAPWSFRIDNVTIDYQ